MANPIGVYVHIPYCVSKCPYCDFKSVAAAADEAGYVSLLKKELASIVKSEGMDVERRTISSIYIGGGTPSVFSAASISEIINAIRGSFEVSSKTPPEITVEVNPDTATGDKLRALKSAGVNRLSIGVQSFSDIELSSIGRSHSAKKAVDAFNLARGAGFLNIGIDLIYGLPGQNTASLEDSVSKAIGLRPEHISLYALTLEEGTPFYEVYKGVARPPALTPLPTEDEELAMSELSAALMKRAGYIRYEISNYALLGFESVHNKGYWSGVDYIGLGASAHSYLSYPSWGRRWWNEPVVDDYMRRMGEGGDAIVALEELSMNEAARESAMLGLRMLNVGIRASSFEARYGTAPMEFFKGLSSLGEDGLVDFRGADAALTDKGVLFSNEVFLRLF